MSYSSKIWKLPVLILLSVLASCSSSGYVTKLNTSIVPVPVVLKSTDTANYSLQFEHRAQELRADTSVDDYYGHAVVTNNENSLAISFSQKYKTNQFSSVQGEINNGQVVFSGRDLFVFGSSLAQLMLGPNGGISIAHGFTEYVPNFDMGWGPEGFHKSSYDLSFKLGMESHIIFWIVKDYFGISSSADLAVHGPIGNEYSGYVLQGNCGGGFLINSKIAMGINAGYSYVGFQDFKFKESNSTRYPYFQVRLYFNRP